MQADHYLTQNVGRINISGVLEELQKGESEVNYKIQMDDGTILKVPSKFICIKINKYRLISCVNVCLYGIVFKNTYRC